MNKKDSGQSKPTKSKQSNEEVSRHLPKEIEKLLSDLPDEKKEPLRRYFSSVLISHETSFYKGPLPPPEILKAYNEAIEGGAERAMRMSEEQAAHRRKQEDKLTNETIRANKWGQNYAFILGALGLILATILGLYDKQIIAATIGGGSLVAIVSAFLWEKPEKKNTA